MLYLFLLFIVTFMVIYFAYLLFVIRREKYLERFINGKEVTYLKSVYRIKIKKSDYKKLANLLAITNSFVIATAVTIVSLFKNIFIEIFVGFGIVLLLILICYHIIGKAYQKNGGK